MNSEITLSYNPRLKGILLVVSACCLWGMSGPVAQYLFQDKHISSEWLVEIRLLFSGLLLLSFCYLKSGKSIFKIWFDKKSRIDLILFSIIGLIGVQYGYFASIKYGNAATATMLQYLSPVIIVGYTAIKYRKFPNIKENISILFALAGTFLIITGGNIHTLSISHLALFWGILSGFAAAFYTLQPYYIIKKWDSTIVVGWGMLIGGLFFNIVHPIWKIQGNYSFSSILGVIFVVLFGTLISFYWYLESTKYIKASETSLLSCIEPLTAFIISMVWLHVQLGLSGFAGSALIISTVFILSFNVKK